MIPKKEAIPTRATTQQQHHLKQQQQTNKNGKHTKTNEGETQHKKRTCI